MLGLLKLKKNLKLQSHIKISPIVRAGICLLAMQLQGGCD